MNEETSVAAGIVPEGERCPHFGECGGCTEQHVAYAEQLSQKALRLEGLFKSYWSGAVGITPSPSVWHYRNKLDLNFGRKHYPEPPPKDFPRETVLGFKRGGKWFWTLDIEECRIGPEGTDALLASVRGWARDRNLTAFSSKTKDGYLRILLIREGKRTGERMAVLITNEGELDRQGFIEAVQSSFHCDSIQWAVFRGKAEIAAADEIVVLDGKATIEEALEVPDGASTRRLRFRISPFSFFQTNTFATERLYGIIRGWVRESRPRILYDLYGGSGGIALTCADLVDRVVSVESEESASIDGTHNSETNRVDDVMFITQKVEDYLRDTLSAQGALQPRSMVVVDPPRAGLHPKALKRLVALHPPEIIYVSCKPQVLVGELPSFLAAYDLVDLHGVDLFPHTEHVEVLARLKRKEEAAAP
ncbi:MAG: 23S rRNA (uracil(1939)-C(5))-methyltransferase RlmD [Candidatus Hydrogenedentes bacterium]|nr:23S rRNA (uracil(1939)-C(5))-methyltransferase RlmD [Candidatus Hydrogenedentota bacterium]